MIFRFSILIGVVGLTLAFTGERQVRAASGAPTERSDQQVERPTVLGIQGSRFTINGKPTFLLGISYYAGLGASEDLRESLETARLDFLTPHRPRNTGSPGETEARTGECLAMLKTMGRLVPVHYQEPLRRGYVLSNPSSADFLADLRGALSGGAAGWCFHNGSQRETPENRPRRSFDLRDQRLFDQLDTEERIVVSRASLEVSREPRSR